MALSLVGEHTALIFAQRELPRALFDARPVHGLNPPSTGQYDNPLRRWVLMPISDPAYGLNREDDARFRTSLLVIPLRCRTTHAFPFKLGQPAASLVTNASDVGPQVPEDDHRL
jgi:hypothetical protein